MMAVGEGTPNAKLARLKYERIGENGDLCLLRIELLTGRKHQIRTQLAASQIPIIGDRKYGSREPFPTGIALHSQKLTLEHPTRKETLEFESNPPHWWKIARFF